MTVAEEIKSFTASDGYAFHYRHWKPAGSPRGFVICLHGIQSHSGWYAASSRQLCEAGFDVRFLDRRGSGLNDVDRGHTPHVDRLVNDVVQFLHFTRSERAKQQPIVLLGLSWGAKLALVTCANRPELVDGLILLYPGICARFAPNAFQRMLIGLAMRTGKKRRLVKIPLSDPALFTSEPVWQQFIRDDELALHHATVSFLNASIALDRQAMTASEKFARPLLCQLAGRDRIVDNDKTRTFLDQFPSGAVSLIEYAGAAHTLEFEPNRVRFVADVLDWLDGTILA